LQRSSARAQSAAAPSYLLQCGAGASGENVAHPLSTFNAGRPPRQGLWLRASLAANGLHVKDGIHHLPGAAPMGPLPLIAARASADAALLSLGDPLQ
jgi:hypothetical protein